MSDCLNGMAVMAVLRHSWLVICILSSWWRDAERYWAARCGAAGLLFALMYGGVMLPD